MRYVLNPKWEKKLLAHVAKYYMSFCYHLVSVVCCPSLTFHILIFSSENRSHHGRDGMIVGFTTTYAISVSHH